MSPRSPRCSAHPRPAAQPAALERAITSAVTAFGADGSALGCPTLGCGAGIANAPAALAFLATADIAAPSVTITPPASPTKAASLMFTLAFSEPITGLAVNDLTVGGTAAGCVIGTPSGSGDEWTVALTGCGDGTVTLTLGAQRVEDLVANVGPGRGRHVLVGQRRPDRADVGRLDRGQGDERDERVRRLHRRGRHGRRRGERPGLLLDELVAHLAAGLRLGLVGGRQRDDHVHDPGDRRDVSRLHPRDGRARDRGGRTRRGRRLDRPGHREARRVGQAGEAGLEHRQRHLHDHVHGERHRPRTGRPRPRRDGDGMLAPGAQRGQFVRHGQRRRVWQRQRVAGPRGGRGRGHRGECRPPRHRPTGDTVLMDMVKPTVGVPTVTPRTGVPLNGSSIPVTVTWAGGDNAGGAGIAGYTLQRSLDGGSTWSDARERPDIGQPHDDRPLERHDAFPRARDRQGGQHVRVRHRGFAHRRLVQQSSGSVGYSGTWTLASSSKFSGGTVRHASTAGRAAAYTFTGRASRSSRPGRASVGPSGSTSTASSRRPSTRIARPPSTAR